MLKWEDLAVGGAEGGGTWVKEVLKWEDMGVGGAEVGGPGCKTY